MLHDLYDIDGVRTQGAINKVEFQKIVEILEKHDSIKTKRKKSIRIKNTSF